MRRSTPRLALFVVLFLVHGIVTALAMRDYGFIGIFEHALADWGARQVASDLTVSLLIIATWMFADARANGRNAWPYFVLMLPLGSFAPLLYLLRRELAAPADAKP